MDSLSKVLLLFATRIEQITSEVMTCEQLREAMLTGFAAHEE